MSLRHGSWNTAKLTPAGASISGNMVDDMMLEAIETCLACEVASV